MDGIRVVKYLKKRQLITPVVLYILNLDPSIRESGSNSLVTYLIPGGYDKEYIDTWLSLLITKLLILYNRVNSYNRASGDNFILRAYIIIITGDGPTITDVIGIKSPGKSKQSY